MHASFPYESNRNSRNEYGVVRRSEMLMQSHPGLDDPLALHNALAGVVDDNQVIIWKFVTRVRSFFDQRTNN